MEPKPKVGILTFHDGFNYGTYLQAYALQKTVLALGYPNEFINYKPWTPWLKEYRWLLHRQRPSRWMRNLKKVVRFRLAHSRLVSGPFHFSSRAIPRRKYDIIIIGSDEVWNFRHPLFGYDPAYFSHGLGAARVLSYAATFGSVEAGAPVPEGVSKGISSLDFVSVRDGHSRDLVRRISGRTARLSLDPTLLCDFPTPKDPGWPGGYILVYGIGFSPGAVAAARKLSDRLGKPLLSIGFSNSWCHRNAVAFDPLRFPVFFRRADCVITNMFHGTMFALKHGRPFCVLSSRYRRSKIETSLEPMGLAGRILPEDGAGLAGMMAAPIDYRAVRRVLARMRRDSLEYLEGALAACNAMPKYDEPSRNDETTAMALDAGRIPTW